MACYVQQVHYFINLVGKFVMNGKSFRDLSPLFIAGYGKGDKNANFDFNLYILLNETDATHCTGQLRFESDMNPMLKMMVEKPLTALFNIMSTKLRDHFAA